MIRHLTGTIIDVALTHVVLEVNGVGYLVHVTSAHFKVNSQASFWTHLAVRETALDVYGFTNRDELEVFELLLTLPKIGPKSALAILTQADIELLKKAVREDDPTYLSKMSGIGKKSAEKIVLGLKDKFPDTHYDTTDEARLNNAGSNEMISDTIDALISLGYPQVDARKAVQQLPPEVTNTNEAVREALKLLST